MISYGKIRGHSRPQEIEITASSVFVAENITPYTEEVEGIRYLGR